MLPEPQIENAFGIKVTGSFPLPLGFCTNRGHTFGDDF